MERRMHPGSRAPGRRLDGDYDSAGVMAPLEADAGLEFAKTRARMSGLVPCTKRQ